MAAVLDLYAEMLSAHGQFGRAAEALLRAAGRTDRPAVRANLLVHAGRLFLGAAADGDKAMGAFQQAIDILGTDKPTPLLRRARIGVGDVWRARGDAERARAAYEAAGAAAAEAPVTAAILQGDMARHVEAYLRGKELDWAQEYLDRWAEATPADKLTGYWSLLRVKVFLAQQREAQAAAEAQTLVAVNPTSPYAPQLLMLVAEAYTQLGQTDRAAAAMRQLVEKYPDSALAAEAAAKLARPRGAAGRPAGVTRSWRSGRSPRCSRRGPCPARSRRFCGRAARAVRRVRRASPANWRRCGG
jgi:TolA-binding protein